MTMTKLLAAACVALITTCPASAEDRAAPNAGTVFNSSDLLGMDVRNAAGESLGDIYDFAVDAKSGRILYAVITYGGTLGIGDKLFAVAPSALKVNDKRDAVMLEVSQADLKGAEGFDANKWPAGPDARWGKSAQGNTDAGNAKNQQLVRLSSLDDLDVYNEANEKLGDIYGFAVDLQKGQIQYIAMQYGGVVGVGSKYFAIPYKAAAIKAPDLKTSNVNFVINAMKGDFEGQQGFDTKTWPATGDVRFKEREQQK